MNIFKRTILGTMKAAKSRTIVTIIGVALSACLFTAVTTTIFSIYDLIMEVAVGWDFQINMHDSNDNYYNQMIEDKNISHIYKINEEGYGKVNIDYTSYGIEGSEAEIVKPRMYIYNYNHITSYINY